MRRASKEKKVFWLLLVATVMGWVFVVQDAIIESMYSAEGHILPKYGPALI